MEEAMVTVPGGPAEVGGGTRFWRSNSGRWAAERFMAAMAAGQEFTAASLRTAGVLRKDEWVEFDTAVIEGAAIRMRGVADLITQGLTRPLRNSMGKTVLEYERISDIEPATVSMDGMSKSENDRPDFSPASLPIPIIHKDFFINLRVLAASRNKGEALDTTMIRMSGRKCAELSEDILFRGGKTFGGLTIYGYTTHPQRNTVSFGTNGNWAAAAKTGDDIIADIMTMLAIAEGDRFYGPYVLYISRNQGLKLQLDYKAASDKTIRQRIMEIDGISDIRIVDALPTSSVLLVQMTPDVVQLIQGEPLQTVQWDIEGGFAVNFKAFMIQVPLIRADIAGRSGIVHMS